MCLFRSSFVISLSCRNLDATWFYLCCPGWWCMVVRFSGGGRCWFPGCLTMMLIYVWWLTALAVQVHLLTDNGFCMLHPHTASHTLTCTRGLQVLWLISLDKLWVHKVPSEFQGSPPLWHEMLAFLVRWRFRDLVGNAFASVFYGSGLPSRSFSQSL